MRTIPPAHISFVFFILMVVFAFSNAPVFIDPDTAWHIASGDLIRSLHKIPEFDTWSFTSKGEPWYNLSWLFDVLFSLLFLYGGFSALYTLTIFVFAASLTFVFAQCIKRGASLVVTLLVLIPTMIVLYGNILARPNMCSIVLTLAFYQILMHYRSSSKAKTLLILPVLMVLWINMHGGFLLAFPLMAIFLGEAILKRDRIDIKNYGIAIALCLAATSLNPYGLSIYYGAYKTLGAAFNVNLVEWRPIEIGHNGPMTIMILLVLCTINSFDKKIALVDRVMAIFMLLLALSSLRHSAITVLLIMPYLTLRLTTIISESQFAERMRSIDAAIAIDMGKQDIKIMASIMAVAAVILTASPVPRDELLKEPVGFARKSFPIKEAAYIEANYPNLRFLTHYNIGGYLDFLWRGRVKVFVDGRANSLYSDELLDDYASFTNHYGFGGSSDIIVSEYKIDGIIVPNSDKEAGMWRWNPKWKLVYAGDVATIYLRSDLVKKSDED